MRARLFLTLAILMMALSACSGVDRSDQAPPKDSYKAFYPVGFPDTRLIGEPSKDDIDRSIKVFQDNFRVTSRGGKPLNILALSSGGSDGAFGAGVMNGWTKSGTRPEFDIVTGVSTGSLIAPFAFLGPEFDENLRRLYTETSTNDLILTQFFAGVFKGQSLFNTTPLRKIIQRELSDAVIGRIADAHEAGRRLYIGTTHLDAAEPVIWDIGQIASYRNRPANELVRDLIWASAAIPIAFTPVDITVTDGRSIRRELHVDGGITKQVFAYPPEVPMGKILRRLGLSGRDNRIWLIHNNPVKPAYEAQKTGIITMAGRSIDTLIASQSIGDIKEVAALATRDGFSMRIMLIPQDFYAESNEFFDKAYMQELYEVGEEMGANPTSWSRELEALFTRGL